MSYKIKSLLYFTCFLASALIYHSLDNNALPTNSKTMGLTEANMEQVVLYDLNELKHLK